MSLNFSRADDIKILDNVAIGHRLLMEELDLQ